MSTLATTEAPALPALYGGSELVELDQSDLSPRRIYLIQGNTRLRNILDNVKLGDVVIGMDAEDPTAERIGGVADPFTVYVLAVSKGVVHIDKDDNGKLTFLTGQPDAEARLANREWNVWRSYHYIIKVEGIDEPVSWMLTGSSGSQAARGVNTLIANRMKSGLGHVTPILIQPALKTKGTNTWTIVKAMPTEGDPEELAAARDLAAAGLARAQYRMEENVAPTTDEPGF